MPVYTYTTLDDPLGINNILALGIDGSGLIVGQYTDNNGEHGFVDSSGIYTTLNDPFATNGTGDFSKQKMRRGNEMDCLTL
jgi:hypothetical protein